VTENNSRDQFKDIGQKISFSIIVGLLYLLFGILQLIASVGLADIPLVPGNAIGVLVLIVIGAVFLEGYRELTEGTIEGISYVYVGILLSMAFGILYLLVLGADALSAYVLELDDFEDWTLVDGMRPELYLSVLPLIGYLKWRKEFELTGSSDIAEKESKA